MHGLALGIIGILALGSTSRVNSPGQYQVSIAANTRNVFYAKIPRAQAKLKLGKAQLVQCQPNVNDTCGNDPEHLSSAGDWSCCSSCPQTHTSLRKFPFSIVAAHNVI